MQSHLEFILLYQESSFKLKILAHFQKFEKHYIYNLLKTIFSWSEVYEQIFQIL